MVYSTLSQPRTRIGKKVNFMSNIILTNLTLIDGTGADPQENVTVVIEGNRIKEILTSSQETKPNSAEVVDCHGQYLLPGLIDGHVHLCSTEPSIVEQQRRNYPSYGVLKSLKIFRETLDQGFTSVRDLGGADAGMKRAVAEKLIVGPRLTVCNAILSQTGGHGDFRLPAETYAPVQGLGGVASLICDGVDEVRRGAREQLRQGADYIKVMAGGGVASAADEITSSQYSPEELRVAVFEAESAGTYVAAHCYCDRSIILCAEAGVYTIEHGNLMTEVGAAAMKKAGSCLMPTLITYEVMRRKAKELNLPDFTIRKNEMALERAYEAIEIAHKMGIKIGSGSDLLGPMQVHKGETLELQARVLGAMGALVATTKTNAEIMGIDDQLGTVEAGKLADLILVNGDPLKDIGLFKDYQKNISLIIQDGQIYKNII